MNDTVEVIDRLHQIGEQLAGKMTELAAKFGPEITELALTAARVDAASELVTAFVALLCSAPIAYYSVKHVAAGWKADGPSTFYPALFGMSISVPFATVALANLADIWAWVGVFEPKLWIAKQVMGM